MSLRLTQYHENCIYHEHWPVFIRKLKLYRRKPIKGLINQAPTIGVPCNSGLSG